MKSAKDKPKPRLFLHSDQYDWKDISAEAWREYTFPGGSIYRIERPEQLAVKTTPDNGDSHRIVCADGVCHYIPRGWIGIRWIGHGGKATYTL